MNVSRENGENNYEVILTIEETAAEWEKAIDSAARRISNEVSIPGFRKGKAPRRIVEQRVGRDAVVEEAYEKFGAKALGVALKQESIEPATYPKFERVQVEPGKDFVMKVIVTPKPEVILGEYKGLVVEKKAEETTDEMVAEHIDKMRDRKATMTDAPEGTEAKDGDMLTLDFTGYVDGETFEGGTGKDYPLQIGSGRFIPGFEEQLIGVKAGEEREVRVTFPDEYHDENLAGKAATFKCRVNKLRSRTLPELDDEFVESTTVFHTVEELKADVRQQLARAAEAKSVNDRNAAAIDMATDAAKMDIPPVMVEDRINQMINELAGKLAQQGMSFEQYLQFSGADIDKLRDDYRETAEKNVRTDLMLEAVAKAENIKVSAEDLDEEIRMMATMYGAPFAQVKKILKSQGRMADLGFTVQRRKTAKFIVDNIADEEEK